MDPRWWITDWLARHPLREPAVLDRERFTAEVMTRVRAVSQPRVAPVWRLRLAWPQVRMALLTATATVAWLIWLRAPADSRQIAWTVERDLQVLASLGEVADVVPGDDVGALEEELQMVDTMRLAEAEPTDAEWVEQTLQLLDELGEETEELLQELNVLDAESLAASS